MHARPGIDFFDGLLRLTFFFKSRCKNPEHASLPFHVNFNNFGLKTQGGDFTGNPICCGFVLQRSHLHDKFGLIGTGFRYAAGDGEDSFKAAISFWRALL